MNAMAHIDMDSLRAIAPSIFATSAHHSRSRKYTFIQTIDAIEKLVDQGFVVTQAKQSRTRLADRRYFTRHMVRLRMPGGFTGNAAPEVVLMNAHDGGSAYKLMGGLIVFACENGLVISDGAVESLHIRHQGDVLQEVITGVNRVMEHTIQKARVSTDWRGIEMDNSLRYLFAEKALELRYGRHENSMLKTLLEPEQLLVPRRTADADNDLWHVFNRVQENLIVGGLSYTNVTRTEDGQRIRHMRSRAIRSIGQDISLNQGLWSLAEQVASRELAVA